MHYRTAVYGAKLIDLHDRPLSAQPELPKEMSQFCIATDLIKDQLASTGTRGLPDKEDPILAGYKSSVLFV
jgi:hypothetical protein